MAPPVLVFYNFVSVLKHEKAVPDVLLNTKDPTPIAIQKWKTEGHILSYSANLDVDTGHGLNYRTGTYYRMVFTNFWRNGSPRQANKRLHRSGQKTPCIKLFISSRKIQQMKKLYHVLIWRKNSNKRVADSAYKLMMGAELLKRYGQTGYTNRRIWCTNHITSDYQMLSKKPAKKQMKCLINWSVMRNSDWWNFTKAAVDMHKQTQQKWRTFVESVIAEQQDILDTPLKTLTQVGSMTTIKRTKLHSKNCNNHLLKNWTACYRFMVQTRIWSLSNISRMILYKNAWRNCQEAIDRLNNTLSDPSYQKRIDTLDENVGEFDNW